MSFRSIFRGEGHGGRLRDLRGEMIRETSAFLTWALAAERGLPRIPRRRVDEGGFATILSRPGSKALVERWWYRTLDHISLDR